MALKDRAIERSPIKAPAMNISLGSIGVLSLATALTAWKEAFEFIFGRNASGGIRAAVLIAAIAAIAIVVAVDMLSRALAVREDSHEVSAAGAKWEASLMTNGHPEAGYTVAAVRSGSDGVEYLILRGDEAPRWYPEDRVALHNGA